MRITKYVHSCLKVEMPEPINRTVLFDPGVMGEQALDAAKFAHLDDIIITHIHGDHVSVPLLKKLLALFPTVRITSTSEVVKYLAGEGVKATSTPPQAIEFFEAPHEDVVPLATQSEEIGVHYLDKLTHPGDSHSFHETKAILALPMTAPWGTAVKAINLALELKPQYVLPIHDWHWSDAARSQSYDRFEKLLGEQGITFIKLATGEPVVLQV